MSGAGRHLGGELPASEVAAGFSRRGSAATASCLGARRPGSRVSRRSQALPAVTGTTGHPRHGARLGKWVSLLGDAIRGSGREELLGFLWLFDVPLAVGLPQ